MKNFFNWQIFRLVEWPQSGTICILCLSVPRIEYEVKKDRFYTSGGTRSLRFQSISTAGDIAQLKPSGKTLNVSIGPGLPKNASK